MTDFKREVIVTPAYDFRPEQHPDKEHPGGGYGISSCRIFFVLIGPKGAVQFQIGTNWYTDSARVHLAKWPPDYLHKRRQPEGWDLGYHAMEPRYENQDQMECQHLPGGKCYYDGSSLNADEMVEAFINGGTEWLWPHLEKYYRCIFEDGPYPAPVVTPQPYPDRKKR